MDIEDKIKDLKEGDLVKIEYETTWLDNPACLPKYYETSYVGFVRSVSKKSLGLLFFNYKNSGRLTVPNHRYEIKRIKSLEILERYKEKSNSDSKKTEEGQYPI